MKKMISSMDKRGDVTITTVILIILGLAALVFLIIGLTYGWDIFFGNLQTVDPGDLEVFAQACKGYAEANLGISFCEFKKIDTGGDDEYVNCRDSRILPLVEESYAGTPPNCGSPGEAEQAFCRSGRISSNKFDTIKVNGKTCTALGVKPSCPVGGQAASVECECIKGENREICKVGEKCDTSGESPKCVPS